MSIRFEGMIWFLSMVSFSMSCTTTSKHQNDDEKFVGPSVDTQPSFDIRLSQGYWWKDDADPSALFFIIEDSLYYADAQDAPYFVNCSDSTIQLQQDGFNSTFAINKLTSDSLILYDSSIGEQLRLFKKADKWLYFGEPMEAERTQK